MQQEGILASLPIWGVFVATLLLALLSVEGGYQWAMRKRRTEVETEAPLGAMVGAMLGFLGFLLAFTFGMAADRYHDRQVALLDETNAIWATYWQAGMIPEPHRTEARKILRNYVNVQLQWAGVEKGKAGYSGNELLNQLWAQAVVVGQQNPGDVDVFLGSVGEVINLHGKRVMVRERSQIPRAIWIVLYLVSILSLAAMGYHGGVAGTNRSPVTVAVAIAFSAVIMLITDLDRPGQGFINVSQQAMIELRDWTTALKP
jgi:hypothetical protein